MSISALSTMNVASPSLSGVASARPGYFRNLSEVGIRALTAADIGAMQPVEMGVLTANQVAAFDPQVLASGLEIYEGNSGLPPRPMSSQA